MRTRVPSNGLLRRLGRHERGATIVEFAIVVPVLCLFLMGFFDIAHYLYTKAVLQGAVQKAARDSGLETGSVSVRQATLDARVSAQVSVLSTRAPVITRRFYRTFSDVAAAKAEPWTTDTNKNGRCDAGEPFTDTNGNGVRDLDGGDAGQGGAYDSVLYTVTVTYPRLFPIYRFIGLSRDITQSATTVLENQPYGDQDTYDAPKTAYCP